MAFSIKSIVASGIIVGGIAVGTLSFTGSAGLDSISNYAKDFKDKIMNLDQSLTNWKESFNILKSDATDKINEANAKLAEKSNLIASLQAEIADLQSKVASGLGNEDILTQEIERLNGELTKANSEVASLVAELEALNVEVADKGTTVETAPSTALPTVNDTETPEVTEPAPAPTEPTEPTEPVEQEPTPAEPETEPTAPAEDTNPTIKMTGYTNSLTEANTLAVANEINTLTPAGTYNITEVNNTANSVDFVIEGSFTLPKDTISTKFDHIRQYNGSKTLRVLDNNGNLIAYKSTGNWIMY